MPPNLETWFAAASQSQSLWSNLNFLEFSFLYWFSAWFCNREILSYIPKISSKPREDISSWSANFHRYHRLKLMHMANRSAAICSMTSFAHFDSERPTHILIRLVLATLADSPTERILVFSTHGRVSGWAWRKHLVRFPKMSNACD